MRRLGRRRDRPRRLRLRLLLLLRRHSGAFALHVDAPAEMRSLGNRDTRRDDVAVDRALVADGCEIRRALLELGRGLRSEKAEPA